MKQLLASGLWEVSGFVGFGLKVPEGKVAAWALSIQGFVGKGLACKPKETWTPKIITASQTLNPATFNAKTLTSNFDSTYESLVFLENLVEAKNSSLENFRVVCVDRHSSL